MTTAPIYAFEDTWNDSGTTFNAIKVDVTNSASASDSTLIDLQVGSTSQFSVDKGGIITANGLLAEGNVDLQGNRLVLDADNDSYINVNGDDSVSVYISGTEVLKFDGAADDKLILDGVSFAPTGAVVGQALGYPNSTTTLEPYTPAGGGDTLKAADETLSGVWVGGQADTITELKARSVTGVSAGDVVYVSQDKRHGFFVWRSGDKSTEVTNDPGEGVFLPPDSDNTGASGAWERIISGGLLNVKWFGAEADGSTDDTTAINNAVTLWKYLSTTSLGSQFSTAEDVTALYWSAGTYVASSPLTIAMDEASLQFTGDGEASVLSNIQFEVTGRHCAGGDVVLVSGGRAAGTFGLKITSETSPATPNRFGRWRNIRIRDKETGILLERDNAHHQFDGITCERNTRGLYATGTTGAHVDNCHFIGPNQDYGVLFEPAGTNTFGEIKFSNCTALDSQENAVRVLGGTATAIECYFVNFTMSGSGSNVSDERQRDIVSITPDGSDAIVVVVSSAHDIQEGEFAVQISGSSNYDADDYIIAAVPSSTSIRIESTGIANGTENPVSATLKPLQGYDLYIDAESATLTDVNDFWFTASNINHTKIKRGYNINFVNCRHKNKIWLEDVARVSFVRDGRGRNLNDNTKDIPISGTALSGWSELRFGQTAGSLTGGNEYVGMITPDANGSISSNIIPTNYARLTEDAFEVLINSASRFAYNSDGSGVAGPIQWNASDEIGVNGAPISGVNFTINGVGYTTGNHNFAGALDYIGAGAFFLRNRAAGADALLGVETAGGSLYYPIVMRGGGDRLEFYNSSAQVGRVASGNWILGVGTSTSYKLDVEGDINVDTGQVYRVAGTQVVGAQVVDANLADTAALTAQTLTDNTGGSASQTLSAIDNALSGVDGTGSNAAPLAGVNTELGNIRDALASLADEVNKLRADNAAQKAALDAALTLIRTHGLGATS